VRTTAQDKHPHVFLSCPVNGFANCLFVLRLDEIARRAADTKSCEGSEGDVLLDECFHRGFSLTLTAMCRPLSRLLAVFVLLTFVNSAHSQAVKRQPAPVMGVAGADWLIRPERIQEEDPDRMLAALEIKRGSVVADIGAGVGYHAWRLAQIVGPTGKVIGEDIQEGMIRLLKKNVDERKLRNVEPV